MHPFLLYPAASKDKHKEIDIQVSAIGEDSVGVLELQSPWLPPGFAGMLHELQHHDSETGCSNIMAPIPQHCNIILYINCSFCYGLGSTATMATPWISYCCNLGTVCWLATSAPCSFLAQVVAASTLQ
jgi:hypothetical protein